MQKLQKKSAKVRERCPLSKFFLAFDNGRRRDLTGLYRQVVVGAAPCSALQCISVSYRCLAVCQWLFTLFGRPRLYGTDWRYIDSLSVGGYSRGQLLFAGRRAGHAAVRRWPACHIDHVRASALSAGWRSPDTVSPENNPLGQNSPEHFARGNFVIRTDTRF